MKSVITDLEFIWASDPYSLLINNLDIGYFNGDQLLHSNINTSISSRLRTRFRRRGDTTTFEGPSGAPSLGSTTSRVYRIWGGPAAWGAAAFGRGDNRKVFEHYLLTRII